MWSKPIFAAMALSALAPIVIAGPDPGNWGGNWESAYGSGPAWQNVGTVKNDIHRACYGWDNQRGFYEDASVLPEKNIDNHLTIIQVYFQPWISSPFSSQLCVNVENNSKVNYEIANLNPNQGFTLGRDDCYNKLAQIVDRSNQGGEIQNAGWWFRYVPR